MPKTKSPNRAGTISPATAGQAAKFMDDLAAHRRKQFLSFDLPLVAAVSCDNCGACCMHMGYPPFIGMFDYDAGKGDPAWLALPRELALEIRQAAVDGRGDKELPCIWLDIETRKCKHYELRPQTCREFKPGEQACLDHRAKRGIT